MLVDTCTPRKSIAASLFDMPAFFHNVGKSFFKLSQTLTSLIVEEYRQLLLSSASSDGVPEMSHLFTEFQIYWRKRFVSFLLTEK